MSLQEWMLRVQGLENEQRSEWLRTLAVVNTIGGIMGADPVTLNDFMEKGKPKQRWSSDDEAAMAGRFEERGLMVPD